MMLAHGLFLRYDSLSTSEVALIAHSLYRCRSASPAVFAHLAAAGLSGDLGGVNRADFVLLIEAFGHARVPVAVRSFSFLRIFSLHHDFPKDQFLH